MHHAYTSTHLQHVHLFIYNIHVYMYTSTCTTYMYNIHVQHTYVQHTCIHVHLFMYNIHVHLFMYNIHVYMYTSSCTTCIHVHLFMYNIHVHLFMYNMYTCTPLHVQHTCTPLHVQHVYMYTSSCTTYMYTCTPTPNTHEHNRWRSGTKPTQKRENKEEYFLPLTTPASCRTPETSASLRPNVELMRTLYPDINNSFKQLCKQLLGLIQDFFLGGGKVDVCNRYMHALTGFMNSGHNNFKDKKTLRFSCNTVSLLLCCTLLLCCIPYSVVFRAFRGRNFPA